MASLEWQSTDIIIIIGGGPAGLFGAYYAGLRSMSARIVDSLDQLGGQLVTLYPEKFIYDVPGFPEILARDLAHQLITQAMQYNPAVALNEQVRTLRRPDDGLWELATSNARHYSRTVLIAAGAGSFTAKRLPNRELDNYEGKGLHYSVSDIASFEDRHVLVVGGGDSAVDWALNLQRVAASITLIHRRDKFRANEASVRKLLDSEAKVRVCRELKGIEGNGHVKRAIIVDTRTGGTESLDVDAILVNFGFVSTLGPIREWGLELEGEGIVVNSKMQTNLPGVFAAGDVTAFPGKLKLIATGFGEAATAVNHAKVFIDPHSKSFPGHSSTIVPRQRQATG